MILDKIIHSFKFYFQELITNKRSVIYSLAGALLAMGAPLGWEVVSYFKEVFALDIDLYYYLFFSTLFVFTIFGFIVGHFHDQVKALADSDPLTGLLNQVSFYKIVNYLYLLAMRKEETISIVMIDIDFFKNVNDNNNHLVGSHVLKELGVILRNNTRSSDAVARFGGDEYIVFLSNVLENRPEDVPERIRKAVENHQFTFQKYKVNITVSLGVVVIPAKNEVEIKDLVAIADQALYQAKNEGRNRVIIKKVNPNDLSPIPSIAS
ncbi:MAG: GGDEF domain-containing protein [Oligoflexales bacterium]